QSGRLLGWHPGARPSHPTPSAQRPKPQGPQLFQPLRTDPARRPPASRLQYRWSPPRRPTAAPRPMLSCNPHSTTRPSAPSRRHQTRPRHLSLLSHPRWPRRHRCRPPPHRTHHHSCSGLTNLLTKCKHSGRKRLTNNPRSRPWPDGYDEVEFAPNRATARDGSPRLADKTTLDVGYPVERGRRERPLFDRTRRVFELLQRRGADQHSRHCALHEDVAQRGLDQAVGMTLADQRFEAPGTLYITAVIGARADRRRRR